MAALPLASQQIRVTGIVQGVGFRPFVWRLAQQIGLHGWVRNDAQGVEILAQGSQHGLAELLERLRLDAPPLARVDSVQAQDLAAEPFSAFSIIASQPGQAATAIGPDVAVCADCLNELFDPSSRRYRHAFITCTHCGPRFTVTRALPYDRPQTSMAAFPLCPACSLDYTAPADRRFHAETTCCPQCGPRLSLTDAQGLPLAGDPIHRTLQLLQAGQIVAIKGLGGFHLACDARNAEAVARLRLLKCREAKPFAVMLANAASVAPYALVPATECALLESRERPIVLLRSQAGCDATLPGIAPGLQRLGVMLPTTPIHFLLFHDAAGRPDGTTWLEQPQDLVLVMTSANPGGEPIVRDTTEAHARLKGIADAFLDHDRDIVARCDDSVLQVAAGAAQFIRRSRGYAPAAIALLRSGPSVLAFGSHLKNTVCVTRGAEAFMSPHIGSLDNAASCLFQDETVQRLCDLLDVKPQCVVHDLHPDDYSTRAALAYAQRHGLPTLAVQHHHAHIAAVCAEHGWQGPLLGLALDGVGLGTDGTAWGGELLQVDGARCQRLGRVFDAAAGLLGISHTMADEAQAAFSPEQAPTLSIEAHGWSAPMPGGYAISDANQFDLLPVLGKLTDAVDTEKAAAVFHAALVAALTDWVLQAVKTTGLTTLAWGGGCFLNALLASQLRQNLQHKGVTVLLPQRTAPGDASIALGQAWVALHSLETTRFV